MLRSSRLAAVGVFLSFAAAHLHAGVAYNQPSDDDGGYFSQNDTSGILGNYATVYDNFTLATTTLLGSVSWVGGYSNPNVKGAMTGVTIAIWADNAGVPNYLGTPIYTTGDVAGNAHETSLGTDHLGSPEFSYSATISFTASAGTHYWISIVPDVAIPSHWEWENGTGGDAVSYQDLFGTLSKLSVDDAFSLSTATPEPVSTVLVGGGLALLALASSRFKRLSA
jgi:hypothetical protein